MNDSQHTNLITFHGGPLDCQEVFTTPDTTEIRTAERDFNGDWQTVKYERHGDRDFIFQGAA